MDGATPLHHHLPCLSAQLCTSKCSEISPSVFSEYLEVLLCRNSNSNFFLKFEGRYKIKSYRVTALLVGYRVTALLVDRTGAGRVARNSTHAITTLKMQLRETWLVTSLTNKRYRKLVHSAVTSLTNQALSSLRKSSCDAITNYRHHETTPVTELHNQSINQSINRSINQSINQ
jgi:hypothetical protein